MTACVTESTVEDAALGWLDTLGWTVKHGPDITPVKPSVEHTIGRYA